MEVDEIGQGGDVTVTVSHCDLVLCGVAPCNAGQFTCFSRRCISMSYVCNGADDCGDASDEGYWHARCPGTICHWVTLSFAKTKV